MRERIWHEMIQAKFGETYLAHYLQRQKQFRKWFKIVTILFSASGIFSWAIWKNGIFSMISCIAIAVVNLIGLIENQIVQSDTDFTGIADLRNLYITHLNKLEKLWTDLNLKIIDEKQAKEIFYELREYSREIEALDNKIFIASYKHLKGKTDSETRNYFKNNFS